MYTNLDCEVLAVVLMGLLLTLVWSESDCCWFLLEISDVTVEATDSVSSCLVSESDGKKVLQKHIQQLMLRSHGFHKYVPNRHSISFQKLG